jgi:hypothetical protein
LITFSRQIPIPDDLAVVRSKFGIIFKSWC